MFGTVNSNWKPFTLFDGTELLVSGDFIYKVDETTGDLLGLSGRRYRAFRRAAACLDGGYFFDSIVRQEPIDESRLDPADNLEEFGLLSEEDLATTTAKCSDGSRHGPSTGRCWSFQARLLATSRWCRPRS